MESKNLFGKLHKKLLFFFLLVGLVPTIVGGTIGYQRISNILKGKLIGEYQGLTKDTADKISLYLYERLHELQVLTDNPIILAGLKFPATLPRVSDLLSSYVSSSGDYYLLALVDGNKNLLAFSHPALQAADPKELYPDTLMGDFYSSALVHKVFPESYGYTLKFSLRVTKYQTEEGKTEGYLIAFVKWDEIKRLIDALNETASWSAWIINQTGTFIAHRDQNKILKEQIPTPLHEQIQKEPKGYRIEKGELVVYTSGLDYKQLPNLGWVIGISQPLSAALAPVEGLKWNVVGGGLLVTLAVSLLALFIANHISRPIVSMTREVQAFVGSTIQDISIQRKDEISILAVFLKALMDHLREMAIVANHISQGDLSLQMAPKSKQDVLGHAFAQMIQYFRELTEIANRLANGDLTQVVHPKSEKDVLGLAFKNMITELRLIKETTTALQDIAEGEGDLTKRLDGNRGSEIGELVWWFNAFMDKLHQIVSMVANTTREVNVATREILASVTEQASIVTQQSSSVSEITSTMEELSTSSRHIADHSQAVVEISTKALRAAEKGAEAIESVMRKMEEINQDNQKSISEIVALGKKSKEITKVMEIINNIADQTKLIAFNAAIEAASAGEAGKRFGVVAAEIRRLATNVMESTGEIESQINEIQQAVNQLVVASEKSSKGIQSGMEFSSQAVELLKDILAGAQSTTDAAKQISLSTQQQKTASDQIVIALREIAEGAKQTSVSINQTAFISKNLAELSGNLQKLVEKFKLKHEPQNDAGRQEQMAEIEREKSI